METSLALTVGIIFILIFMGLILWIQKKRYRLSSDDQKKIKKHWNDVKGMALRDAKHAILEADKVLDEALKFKGYKGSLGEKLKQAHGLFRDANTVWSAHKLRNRIAHELNITVTSYETKIALNHFENGLHDLGFKL